MTQIIFLIILLSVWQNPTPIYVGPGDQEIDVVISDGEGGAAVIWWDDVTRWNYMQVIDSAGNLKWDAEGVAIIANASLSTQNPDVFQDDEGNYWVALEGNEDIYVQKLSPTGQRMFGDDGIAVCTLERDQSRVRICSSGNDAILTWWDSYWEYVFAQRVNADGSLAWDENGIQICEYTNRKEQRFADPVPDGRNGALVILEKWFRDESDNYIFAQHLDSLGNRLLEDTCRFIHRGSFDAQFNGPKIGYALQVEDGCIFPYRDQGKHFVQRVDTSGNILWDTAGVILMDNEQGGGDISPLFTGGLFSTWGSVNGHEAVYANRITLDGDTIWGTSGKQVWQVWADQPHGGITPSINENGIVVWRDTYDELGSYDARGILAQRIDTLGNILWAEEKLVCGTNGTLPHTISTFDKAGLIIWEDSRNGNPDVLSAKIDSLGNILGVQEQPQPALEPLLYVWQPFPNPTASTVNVRFSLGVSTQISVNVFDVSGRKVTQITQGWLSAGEHSVQWNGTSQNGLRVSAGVYFVNVLAGGASETAKIILLN